MLDQAFSGTQRTTKCLSARAAAREICAGGDARDLGLKRTAKWQVETTAKSAWVWIFMTSPHLKIDGTTCYCKVTRT
jgi:hypothetical protein